MYDPDNLFNEYGSGSHNSDGDDPFYGSGGNDPFSSSGGSDPFSNPWDDNSHSLGGSSFPGPDDGNPFSNPGNGDFQNRGKSKSPIRPARSGFLGSISDTIHDLSGTLPELWGIDMVLILVSLVGIISIVTNWSSVLLAVANAIYAMLSLITFVGVFIIVFLLLIFLLRRRRW